MYLLYSLLTAAGMLLLSPYFLIRGLVRGKNLNNIPERLGRKFPAELQATDRATEKSIWIHAVSVGEVLAILPLAQQIKAQFPQLRLIVSTTTVTGQQLARERMRFADAIFFFPLDWVGPVRRALRAANAKIVIIVETEIWPNFLRECRRAQTPVIFVNGRLSERSFRGFQRAISFSGGLLKGFLRQILNDASLFLMQGNGDATRLLALGAPDRRVLVVGNLKYDLLDPAPSEFSTWLEIEIEKSLRGPVVIAGSVMANEEHPILEAFALVEREFPGALLILAPRKPEQFENAAALVKESGRKIVRRRDISLSDDQSTAIGVQGSVVLLDSLGELAELYRLADVVFVGGSLTANGGHNILEPALFGKVPVHGPSMENFREVATSFLNANASVCVRDSKELGAAWLEMLRDPARTAQVGAAGRELVDRNRGATTRVLAYIQQTIAQTSNTVKRSGDSR